jgi:hypothetical protein
MRINHTMEPEKYRVSGRIQVEPTRPEPDPKTRNFRVTRPEPDPNLTRKPEILGFLKIFKLVFN